MVGLLQVSVWFVSVGMRVARDALKRARELKRCTSTFKIVNDRSWPFAACHIADIGDV